IHSLFHQMRSLLIILSSLFVLSFADLSAIHEKPITIRVKNGSTLTLNIPASTTIWRRKFKREGFTLEYPVDYLDKNQDNATSWSSSQDHRAEQYVKALPRHLRQVEIRIPSKPFITAPGQMITMVSCLL
ncbi:hypothetical protein PMAYCL1PPCAC_21467, partial [Pristionchus mayeri]